MKFRYLFFLLLGCAHFIPDAANAYQLDPVFILGDPIAPAILDQEGNGFCVTSEQANYGKFALRSSGAPESFVFDAGAVFGNEKSFTPPSLQPIFGYAKAYRWAALGRPQGITNTESRGTDFPQFVNLFMDRLYFPREVFAPVSTGRLNFFFDLSSHPNGNDPNGDFTDGNPISQTCPDRRGCRFPAIPNLPNFNPVLDDDLHENQYIDPHLKSMFPEVTRKDEIRNTASRYRGFLNVKKDMTDRDMCFGMYADDGASLSISDSNKDAIVDHVILSATSNRCEACTLKEQCPLFQDCSCKTRSEKTPSDPLGTTLSCGQEFTTQKNLCGTCAPSPKQTGQRWRMTNCVRFKKPGMYPIEILHVAFGGNSALEVSVKLLPKDDRLPGDVGQTRPIAYNNWGFPTEKHPNPADTYQDWEDLFPNQKSLKAMGFTLLDPAWIFQSTTGFETSCGLGQCVKRPKSDPNFGKGCGEGNFCNEAGNCEPCDEKSHCGLGCTRCAEVNLSQCDRVGTEYTCVQCRKNSDCEDGQTCDANDHQCHCKTDFNCKKGQSCQGTLCKTCDSQNSCAGNSCSCCRDGMKCAVLDETKPDAPSCVECTSSTDCPLDQTCDVQNHRCTVQISACNADNRCGSSCLPCPTDKPFCLDGRVCTECRSDIDCGDAQYCLSGQCSPCQSDRRCGSSCHSCPTDKPFCDGRSGVESAQCVGCFKDEQCGINGKCDLSTQTCENTCKVTCPAGLLCDDTRCIECRSSVQCGCGQACDTQTGQCLQNPPDSGQDQGGACASSADCQGDECCDSSKQCALGHCNTTVKVKGGALCACSATPAISTKNDDDRSEASNHPWLFPVVILGLFLLIYIIQAVRGFRKNRPASV